MVTAIIILSIIGLISATLLYIISRKFHVEEDSRIDEIESILPGANCGGWGGGGGRMSEFRRTMHEGHIVRQSVMSRRG